MSTTLSLAVIGIVVWLIGGICVIGELRFRRSERKRTERMMGEGNL